MRPLQPARVRTTPLDDRAARLHTHAPIPEFPRRSPLPWFAVAPFNNRTVLSEPRPQGSATHAPVVVALPCSRQSLPAELAGERRRWGRRLPTVGTHPIKAGCGNPALHLLRLIARADVERTFCLRIQILKRYALPFPLEEIRRRDRIAGPSSRDSSAAAAIRIGCPETASPESGCRADLDIPLLTDSTAPNFSTAWRRASGGDKPARRFSAVCRAMCSSTSALNRSSSRPRSAVFSRRLKNRLRIFWIPATGPSHPCKALI